MKSRIKRIFECECPEVDAVVIQTATEPFIDATLFYVTGMKSGIFEGTAAIFTPGGDLTVVTSRLEEHSARLAAEEGGFEVKVYEQRDKRLETMKEHLEGHKRLGINPDGLTHRSYSELKEALPGVELVDVSKAVKRARLVKDEREIETLREAGRIASQVAEEIAGSYREGVKEYEIAAEINYLMQKKGAQGPSFATIVAFGANAAEPHYSSGDVELQRGQCALMDFGALYKRYCSDITRTFFMGEPDQEQKEMYDVVRQAQQIGLDNIRPGVKAGDVHNKVAEFIDGTRFKGRFTHSLGHSIGLSVHDGGVLHPIVDTVLEEGMVFTVEPGVYLPGKGGVRIEDDIVVRKDGCELLTSASRDLVFL